MYIHYIMRDYIRPPRPLTITYYIMLFRIFGHIHQTHVPIYIDIDFCVKYVLQYYLIAGHFVSNKETILVKHSAYHHLPHAMDTDFPRRANYQSIEHNIIKIIAVACMQSKFIPSR